MRLLDRPREAALGSSVSFFCAHPASPLAAQCQVGGCSWESAQLSWQKKRVKHIQMGPSGPLHVFLYSNFFLFSLLSLSLSLDVEDDKGTLRPRMESKGSHWWLNHFRSKARHTQAHSHIYVFTCTHMCIHMHSHASHTFKHTNTYTQARTSISLRLCKHSLTSGLPPPSH